MTTPMLSRASIWVLVLQNLTGCTCVSSDKELATASPGKCPTPGCQEAFLIFLCVICACSLIGAMAQTPSVIILIRYHHRHRTSRCGQPCLDVNNYVQMYTTMSKCGQLCLDVNNYVQMYTTMSKCGQLCPDVDNYVQMCTNISIYIQLCVNVYNYVHICTHLSICIQLCCKCVQICPNVYNCVHICTSISKC